MKLTFIDLELNQPSGRIIQIGAVIGDVKTKTIVDRLRIYVNPYEPLNPEIITLCNITQDQISTQGIDLNDAYVKLKKFHKQADFINPVTWGGGDSEEIRQQINDTNKKSWCFGRRWIDVKTVYVSHMLARDGVVHSRGLEKAMRCCGLTFHGRAHDALVDAENTFHMYCYLLDQLKIKELV